MTDEEKKAIEYFNTETITEEMHYGAVLVNLIEKKSKEIEEYKKQLDLDYVDKHFVPIERYNQLEKEIEELNKSDESKEQSSMNYYNLYKELVNKIKAKIEEIAKEWAEGELDGEWYEFMKYHLQSLLEKE